MRDDEDDHFLRDLQRDRRDEDERGVDAEAEHVVPGAALLQRGRVGEVGLARGAEERQLLRRDLLDGGARERLDERVVGRDVAHRARPWAAATVRALTSTPSSPGSDDSDGVGPSQARRAVTARGRDESDVTSAKAVRPRLARSRLDRRVSRGRRGLVAEDEPAAGLEQPCERVRGRRLRLRPEVVDVDREDRVERARREWERLEVAEEEARFAGCDVRSVAAPRPLEWRG